MKRLILWSLLGAFLCWSPTAQAAKVSNRFAVLDFDTAGRISSGAGETLAMILYNSLNARRYNLLDPHNVRELLAKHEWRRKRQLTAGLLADLKKLGVRFVVTGSVGYHYRTFTATYRVVSVDGRILHNDVLPPVQSWVGLISTLQYSMRMLLRGSQRAQPGKGKITRPTSAIKKLIARIKKAAQKKKISPLKPFKTLVKGAKRIDGLFPIYTKKNPFGQPVYMMEINPKQLGKLFLFSPTLEGGTGDMLLTFAMLDEFPFMFVRKARALYMIQKNVNFRVDPKSALNKIIDRSFANSIRATALVLSAQHPKRKSFLIDATKLLTQDLLGVGRYRRFFSLRASGISKLRSYPKNVELLMSALFFSRLKAATTPPGQAMIKLRYSISTMPEPGYRPRYADDRVGHFMMVAKDFTRDDVDNRFVRYVTRWRLEKKDPKAKLSAPKKPITYWLENGIPKRYRRAVSKGITMWNQAFRRIGFKNAVVARQQPDNAKWDPADIRYNSIRWFLSNGAGFAQGPSRIDPLTGEIYDADIRVSSDMALFLNQQFNLQIEPLSALKGSGLEFMIAENEFSGLKPFGQLIQNYKQQMAELKKKAESPLHNHRHQYQCTHMSESRIQAAFGWNLMTLRGAMIPGTPQAKKFIDDFVISVISHEVGHTLGLRHNFKASTLHTLEQLQDPKRTKAMGLTNSVMEYTPVNLAGPGQKQGEFWQTTLGPYDHWAIEYAYRPLPAKTPEAELPFLNKIASRVAKHELAYATDEDAFGFTSVDPTAERWDLGKDPLRYAQHRAKIAGEMWKRIEKYVPKSKRGSYQRMRYMFNIAASTHLRAGLQAARFVGGLYHRRDHIGDPGKRLPFQPVPAKKQRKALRFLVDNYFGPKAYRWSPSLLNKLAPERLYGFSYSIFFQRIDYPLHRTILALQLLPIYRLLYVTTLARVEDIQLRQDPDADYLSVSEIFRTITDAVWHEVLAAKPRPTSQPTSKPLKAKKINIPSTRRALQNNFIELLHAYSQANGLSIAEAPVAARSELVRLRKMLRRASRLAANPSTKLHLKNARARVRQLLNTIQIRIR
ncbi:MAG: zinc-dependent metalloprotease [Myxococcales bacterium]|nr:zinc-dependent metalloprotease [Myxococcales bacterium]